MDVERAEMEEVGVEGCILRLKGWRWRLRRCSLRSNGRRWRLRGCSLWLRGEGAG